MSTTIPDNIKRNISAEVKENFGIDIDEDIIEFIRDFQSRVAFEEGFSKQNTIKLYKLAVFKFNTRRIDARNTMRRLLIKYDGDRSKALVEFRQIGKVINLEYKNKLAEERANRVKPIKRSDKVISINGKFTVV